MLDLAGSRSTKSTGYPAGSRNGARLSLTRAKHGHIHRCTTVKQYFTVALTNHATWCTFILDKHLCQHIPDGVDNMQQLLRTILRLIRDFNKPRSMFIDCVYLCVADAVDVINTLVPAIFLYFTTAHSYHSAVAVFAKNHWIWISRAEKAKSQ